MHFFKKFSIGASLFGLLTSLFWSQSSVSQAQEIEQSTKTETTYIVKEGDSLQQIAKDKDRDFDYLVALNDLDRVDNLEIGQILDLGDGETLEDGNLFMKLFPAYVPGLADFKYVAPQAQVAYSGEVQAVAQTQAAVVSSAPVVQTDQGGTIVLANGNTAGEIGSYAAQHMEAATGVSASTWEYIIARESNGQVDAYNPSGASGLFQTMPGWGSTATVDDQIQAAINAYNAQGLSAWGQ